MPVPQPPKTPLSAVNANSEDDLRTFKVHFNLALGKRLAKTAQMKQRTKASIVRQALAEYLDRLDQHRTETEKPLDEQEQPAVPEQ